MGYPTKVQLIKRKQSEQWYINFPAAVAQAMEFERGETVEWIIEDKESLVLRRQKVLIARLSGHESPDYFDLITGFSHLLRRIYFGAGIYRPQAFQKRSFLSRSGIAGRLESSMSS